MKLVITAAAEADLRQIGDWIAHDSRASGLAFTDDLRDRAAIIVITAGTTVMASSVDEVFDRLETRYKNWDRRASDERHHHRRRGG